jgi:tetratricopeptide (TPR) repeat protein
MARDMKQDEFVSIVTRATLWVEENTRTVLIGAGALVVLIVMIVAAVAWQRSRREEAYNMLAEVQKVARTPLAGEQGAGPEAFPSAEERAARVVEVADRMLESTGGGVAGRWARYSRAGALLELGRIDEAAKDATEVAEGSGDGTLLGGLALVLAGRAEEARGNHQGALDLSARAAENADGSFPPEMALMDRARCLFEMGNRQEAIDTYQRIVDVYPGSPLAEKASGRLQDLREGTEGT